MKRILSLLLILFLLLPVVSSQLTLDKTTYYPEDQILFTACNYNSADVTCLDDSNLQTEQLNQSCSIYGFEASDLTCQTPEITVDDESEELQILDFQTSLQNALEDPIVDDLDRAKRIYGYSLLGEQSEIDRLVNELRTSRLEENKCWGDDECDLEYTVDIVSFLEDAGFNRSSRIYHDAMLWIESRQNPEVFQNGLIEVNSSTGSDCDITLENGNGESFEINNSNIKSYEKDITTNSDIETYCEASHCTTVKNRFGETLYDNCVGSNQSQEFDIDRGCWRDGRECSDIITSKALRLNHLRNDNYDRGRNWVERNKEPVPIEAEKVPTREEVLSNMYFYEATGLDNLRSWLWFNQNNEGSFSKDDKEWTTLEALKVFNESRDEEWMVDAEDYIMRERPEQGWDDVYKAARSLDLLGPDRAPIRNTPLIISNTGSEESFDLRSEEEFEAHVDTNNEFVEACVENEGRSATVDLSLNTESDGIYSGTMSLTNSPYERKIPYSLQNIPELTFNFDENYYFQEASGDINVPIQKSDSNLSCQLSFNQVFQDRQLSIQDQNSVRMSYEVEEQDTYDIRMEYECDSSISTINGENVFTLRVYPHPPFAAGREFDVMRENPGEFIIRNRLDEQLTLDLSFENDVADYAIQSPVTLEGNHEASVFVYKTASSDLGAVEDNTLQVESVGHQETVPFQVELNDVVHESPPDVQKREISDFPWILTIFLIAGVMILAIITYYFMQQPAQEPLPEETEEESEEPEEEPEEDIALGETLAAVEKAEGEDEQEIEEDLEQKGYNEEEIDDILEELDDIMQEQEKEE